VTPSSFDFYASRSTIDGAIFLRIEGHASPGTDSSAGPGQHISVSPNNPCPFLRGLVAGVYLGGEIVPLSKLTGTVEAATSEK
jgi:hypothetical protein